jgi:cell division protein FtsB
MKLLICFCLIISLVSCANEEANQNEQEVALLTFSKQQIQNLNYTEYILDSKVKVITKNWIKYNELEGIIANLNQADLSYFKDNNEILEALIKDLKQSIPEQLNSPPILSRLIALETKLYKLESVVNLSNSTPDAIMSSIKEVLVAFSNLNLQMNKKIERESQKIIKP